MASSKARKEQPNPVRKIERPGVRRLELVTNPTDKIQSRIEERVFGQTPAAKTVANALIRFEGGMRDPNRPIGVFLFLGPSGVGKTEMALSIADTWFDGDVNDENFLKLDMSEFSESHTVSRIVGPPPGYIGSTEPIAIPHAWANRKRRKVLLLDEWEKAHQEVQKIFLSVFENATLKARNGTAGFQPLFFGDTLIIATTNAGSVEMTEAQKHKSLGFRFPGESTQQGKSDEEIEKIARKSLTRYFRPELLRRMNTVVFRELQAEHYHPILQKFLLDRNELNLAGNAPTILLSREVRNHLIAKALKSKELGGSALRDVFEEEIVALVSTQFVAGTLQSNEVARFELEQGAHGPQFALYAWTNPDAQHTMTIDDLPQEMLARIRHLSGDDSDAQRRRQKTKSGSSTGDVLKKQEFTPLLSSGLPKVPPFKKR